MNNMHSNNDRSRPSVIGLVSRWRALVIVITLAGVAGGAYLGSRTEVDETAEARLVISATQASPEALPGVTQASMALAGMYARLVTVDPVLEPVAEQLGIPLVDLRDDVRGSPLPESAIVRVIVTAPTPDEAMRTADLVAESLVAYDESVSEGRAVDESDILASYDQAATELMTAELAALRAQTALDELTADPETEAGEQSTAAPDPDPEAVATAQAELVAAQIQVDRANLLLEVFSDAYRSSVATEQLSLLRSLGAASATGPTPSDLAVGAFGGLVVGFGLAAAFAYLFERRRRVQPDAIEEPSGEHSSHEHTSNGAKHLVAPR